jgi:iron complex outermembrane receptor protein
MIPLLIACNLTLIADPPVLPGDPLVPAEATIAEASSNPEFGDNFDLTELSLEELMDIEVTIATRSEEPLSSVPAAVYVLTGDEIRRAGHSSIPEALRMVPGMHVSRWTPGDWDVTARGFGTGLAFTNSAYLNQLLVMIDGVIVYSPLFAGMFWTLQDVLIEDVERIEVVRGPGGILWGSNAVHGVVHIITKSAAETEGVQITARGGTDDRYGSVRYGGKIGESGDFRVWFKGAEYDNLYNPYGGFDYGWELASAGGRFDWSDDGRKYSFWARVYKGSFNELGYDLITYDPIQVLDRRDGAQLYASTTDEESGARWQAWYTNDEQDLPTLGDIHIDVYDLEYQRPVEISETHRINVGAGYRRTQSRLYGDDPFWYDFSPNKVNQDTWRIFAVDTIALDDIDSTLTIGLAGEHNDFTDFEFQPTMRYAWYPKPGLTVWGGVSRAVRTPSLEERTLTEDSAYAGDPNFRSETLVAYELGVRILPRDWVSADLAVFFNDYDHLHFADSNATPLPYYYLTNGAKGESYGAELALDFQISEDWKVRSSYTYEHGSFEGNDGTQLSTGKYSPSHIFNARSYYNLTPTWEFDTGFYMVEGLGAGLQGADYTRFDARIGWRPEGDFEFYVGVQDAFNRHRSELDEYDNLSRAYFLGVTFSH